MDTSIRGYSESGLAQFKLISIPFRGSKRLQVGKFLGLNHLNTITFFVHEHSSLLAIYKHIVPLDLPLLLIYVHLRTQVGLVVHKQFASLCLHGFLFFLLLLLSIDNRQVLLTSDPRLFLKFGIDVCKLLLAALVQVLQVLLMLGISLRLLGP